MQKKPVVVVGGANVEYIIKSDKDIVQGSKNFVEIEEFYGGSGVNYTLRLLHVGLCVYPVLFVGEDHFGREIQEYLLKALHCEDSKVVDFIKGDDFLLSSLKTPRSTIIVEGVHRTILTQDSNTKNHFFPFLSYRLQKIPQAGALVIGHIHNDKPSVVKDKGELSTLFAIDYFKEKETLLYANFGSSQIAHGIDLWREFLPSLDILQLNIYEMKRLFTKGEHQPSLMEIIEELKALNISAIITLDKFGALGIYKGCKETLFMARPVDLKERFVDSTGAGDAFCAGMVAVLNGNKHFSYEAFKEAMEMARSWAVYACQFFGGANGCPSRKEINAFHQDIIKDNEVLLYRGNRIKDIAALIDSTMELQ